MTTTDEIAMQESRTTSRYAFASKEIAKMIGGMVPAPDAFEAVRCADISRDGFAFYQAMRPDFEQVMVALGLAPDFVYLRARVAHTELIEMCGSLVFRVGCRFNGCADWDEQTRSFVIHDDVESALLFLVDRTDVSGA
jgi:hypothetical protein